MRRLDGELVPFSVLAGARICRYHLEVTDEAVARRDTEAALHNAQFAR